jgi:hypothetical protein
VLIG